MVSKSVIVVCVQLFLAQLAFSQCIGRGIPIGAGNPNLMLGPNQPCINNLNQINTCGGLIGNEFGFNGMNPAALGVSNGGAFVVTSSSPIPATGLSIVADNLVIDGALAITGKMPFLGAVSVDGCVPAAGQGAVVYNCGNGEVGIVSEGGLPNAAGLAGIGASGLNMGLNNLGLNGLGGIGRVGCGCA